MQPHLNHFQIPESPLCNLFNPSTLCTGQSEVKSMLTLSEVSIALCWFWTAFALLQHCICGVVLTIISNYKKVPFGLRQRCAKVSWKVEPSASEDLRCRLTYIPKWLSVETSGGFKMATKTSTIVCSNTCVIHAFPSACILHSDWLLFLLTHLVI